MLRNWFGARVARSPERNRFFRPQLEYLEGRLAPSNMGMAPQDDNGGGDDHGRHERHINRFDDFDTNDDDSFHVVLDNVGVNAFFSVQGMATVQLTEALFTNLIQAVQTTPGATLQNAFSLVTDEFQLAQDTGTLISGILSGAGAQGQQSLLQDIHALQNAIQTNPLEASASGQVAGVLAFDVAFQSSLAHLQLQGSGQGQAGGQANAGGQM